MRAQRLSASSEDSPSRLALCRRTRASAQRLSASSEDSHLEQVLGLVVLCECSTPFGIIGRLTSPTYRPFSESSKCSTPFGIIGRLTPFLCDTQLRFPFVLNAFRHHRKTHLRMSVSILLSDFACSTPFGIIGRLTSEECDREGRRTTVLNAFRHHRKTHRTRQAVV